MKHSAFWTWPDLRLTFHILPWHWKLRPSWYADGDGWKSMFDIRWLGVDITFYGHSPSEHGGWFPMEEDL